ncbi:hypothetical protein SAMN04487819_11682 [Actinopolyspora alba]|uniref:Uncharacterized protein n=1 Tax=Actinopolyspora alba TaxID=673379 RepID=A0A1I2BFP7_9ACTN|nr:hypothetical protein [Actinopolyspora alba]SFE55004.1 hypothetical protein SAMN04487819_11682 [Actinopolyspora alba]
MATTLETAELRESVDRLRAHAADLLDARSRPVMRDDGTVTAHPEPSLLDQLRDAIAPGTDRRPGTGAGSRTPISIEAHDRLAEIDATSTRIQQALASPPHRDVAERLRGIVATVTATTDRESIDTVTAHLNHWVREIRVLFDPPRRLHVAAPCPACQTRMVATTGDDGETVQTPALWVDGQTGCRCHACGHHWPTSHLEHLAAVLGCVPLPE